MYHTYILLVYVKKVFFKISKHIHILHWNRYSGVCNAKQLGYYVEYMRYIRDYCAYVFAMLFCISANLWLSGPWNNWIGFAKWLQIKNKFSASTIENNGEFPVFRIQQGEMLHIEWRESMYKNRTKFVLKNKRNEKLCQICNFKKNVKQHELLLQVECRANCFVLLFLLAVRTK